MRDKRAVMFYIFAAGAVLALFCVWYLCQSSGIRSYEAEKRAYYTDAQSLSEQETELSVININTADGEELAKLPYIGEELAKRIIEYRQNNGGFNTKEDIKEVNGIGDKIYNEISNFITVN